MLVHILAYTAKIRDHFQYTKEYLSEHISDWLEPQWFHTSELNRENIVRDGYVSNRWDWYRLVWWHYSINSCEQENARYWEKNQISLS